MGASKLQVGSWNTRNAHRALSTLGALVAQSARGVLARRLWGFVGALFMVLGVYLFAASFSAFNILQAECGTMLFLVGANIVVWSTDR